MAADTGLRRDAIGLREVLFQSITDMAPGAAIAASIPAGAALAGGALPLAVVLALVACLFSAWSIGQLARELPSSGSMATYAARGLHPSLGFLVAWAYAMVGWLIPPLVLLQLGFTVAGTLNFEIKGYPANLWWPWAILGLLIIAGAGYFGVRTSARFGTILGVFEIAVFLIMGILLVIHAGSHNTLSVFTTKYTPPGFRGFSGVVAGSVFTILAFGGFEGAAPLAEEARNPRRTIQLAVLLATLLIGALYVFTTYAAAVAFGPSRFSTFTTSGNSSWEGLARAFYGLFWILVFLAIVNSTLANSNAGVNVSTRTSFAMARVKAFPTILADLNPKHRSPVNAIVLGTVISLAVMLGLGLHYGATTAFAMVGTALVILIVGVYIVMNAACIGYFTRSHDHKVNPLSHIIIPILGIAAFVPAWCAGAGIKIAGLKFITPLPAPLSYMGPATAIWMVLGLAYLVYLYIRAPQRVVDVGLLHLDAE
ncbi:MAG TPA: APC family permease [Streptosporangiaceae bacterium]|nr:APC family permease [Streptosporangiaceae bacterium]